MIFIFSVFLLRFNIADDLLLHRMDIESMPRIGKFFNRNFALNKTSIWNIICRGIRWPFYCTLKPINFSICETIRNSSAFSRCTFDNCRLKLRHRILPHSTINSSNRHVKNQCSALSSIGIEFSCIFRCWRPSQCTE